MTKEGFIFLHRKFLEWEWYDDANAMRLFLHCLLNANHKDGKWQGKVIKRGSFITGRLKLASSLKLSEMEIRTALKHLKSTNEITIKTTSQYSIITVNNWDKYQQINQRNNQQITNKQPTNNQQITTNNNDNNDNNENNKEEEDEETFPNLKNWHGEYMNVYLTDEQIGKLKNLVLNDNFLSYLINDLSANIAVGKAPQYDEAQPWGHYAMVKRYWEYRKNNPQKFKKTIQSQTTTEDIVEKVRKRLENEP